MKSNKLKSLVAMATMAGVISMTSTTHQSNKVNKKLLTVKKVDSKDSTSNNINPNDLNIEISNINITKESAVGFTNNSSYVPENNIPKTTNIATSNTEVVYKIAVSLSSKTGKFYKIPKLYLTANPFAQYMGKNANDPKEKEAAAKLLKSINVQLSELKDLNTTSTFVITAIVGVGNADWDVKVNPNFQIHAMVGNKEKVVPIKAPDILLTNHYTDNVYAGLKITHSENNKHESYLDIDLNNGNSAPNNPGIYNPANYKPQSITFKIDNPDSKDIDIIPLKVPGFTVNPDGTYTVDSRLIGQVNRLFKVVTKTNGVLNKEITVVPLSEKYNTNIDLNKTTTFNYDSASATLTQNAIGDSFTMSQGTQASGWYNVYDTFSSKLSAGVPGKYKIYSGSLLSDGNMVVIDGKNLIAIKDQTYVSLNKNAENILLTGTPSEKAAIFQRIVNGDMSGIGQAFSYDKILQMYKSGEELPQINFTYKSEEYNGNPLNMVGYYHEIPIHGAWTPMINRVFTLGVLQGNYSKEEKESMEEAIEKGALSSDTIIKNNGEFSGFLLSPPDNITNQDIYDQKPVEGPVGNGTYYTTESRYGSISHDISSAITYAYEKVTTTIDSPKGAGNIVQNHPVSWLDNSHKFYFYIYGYGSGITEQYTKNTVLNVNMDAPFVLTSPVTINGVTVPKEDYKIEGNRILIRFPQRFNMSPQPRVEFEAHYITFGPQTITVSAHLEGKMGHQGIVYNYNNNPNSSELEGGATSQIVLFNSQVLTGETSNECMHYSNGVDSNGNVTLTDVVHNGKYETKKYFVVGQIPTAGSNNLPGNEGAPSVGGLGSELLSLDTSGAPTWVLPKSALNSINQDILDNTNALDLKGKLKYIESPGSGWVRYIPGQTNLSGMVAYFVTPTIEPGKDFYVNYNVHLTGINRNTYQIVNSAFKYYTPSGNLGSTSNIVNLTPPGENLSYDWISKVVDLNGHAIPSGALSNTINYNGEKISLSNLIGHGPDNDGKSDLTPQELQEKINLATNKEVMKELGYKLDGIYVNGQKVSKEWFNTVGILNNSTLTHVKFVISKVSTDTVKVMEHSTDSNGKELITQVGKTTTTTGAEGTNTGLKTPEIPEGYHIVNITDNGKVITTGVPSKFTGNNQNIVYNIAKNITDKVYVDVKTTTGNILTPSHVVSTGAPGSDTNVNMPEIPKDYHIVKVTVNNKVITQNANGSYNLPKTFSDNKNVEKDDKIEVIVAKNPTTIVEEHYQNGTSVVPNKTTTNLQGAKVNTGLPELPKGYQVTKITVNGKEVSQNEVPTTQGNDNQIIVYTIGKQPTDTVKVVYEDGKPAEPSVSVTGNTGDKTVLNVPKIPEGYHVVSVTNTTKGVDGIPKTFGNTDNTTTYTIAKNVKDKTYAKVVTDINGKVVTLVPSKQVGSGKPDSKEQVITLKVPEGYKIVKVTINGKEVTPNKDGKYEVTYNSDKNKESDNNIVITVKHVPVQDTVKVVEGDKTISTTTTKPGMPGEDNGITTPNVPTGYHIGNITVDGKTVDKVPTTYGDKDQTIVYHLVENQPNDIKANVVTEDGKTLVKDTIVAKGPEGSEVTCDKTAIPKGYHLDKVLYNGKVISTVTGGKVIYMLPDTIPSGKEGQLTYVVSPDKSSATVTVTDGTKTFSSTTTTGNVGSKITGDTPVIPKGYKVINITVNGQTVSEKDLPKVYGNTPSKIVYHITKIPTGEVKQEVVTTKGTIIEEPTVVANGEVGTDTNLKPYTPPKGYHIVKVIVDGKTLTTKEDKDLIHNLPSIITDKTQTVKYVIGKNVEEKGSLKYEIKINGAPYGSGELQGTPGKTASYDLPHNKYLKLESITVNGRTITTPSDVQNFENYHGKFEPNGVTIIYNYKTVTTPSGSSTSNTTGVGSSTSSSTTKTTIGDNTGKDKAPAVKPSIGKDTDKTTPVKPVTPEHKSNTTKPSTGDNTGKDKTPAVKPSTGKDTDKTTPVKPVSPEHKDKTTVTVNVVGGPKEITIKVTGDVGTLITKDTPTIPKGYKVKNITVNGHTVSEKDLPKVFGKKDIHIVYHITKVPTDKTPEVKPVTPEHKDNTTKPSTGDNTGKDKTPDVKPSTGKDTDKTTPVKPLTPEHKDNTIKPSTGDNTGKDKTPDVKPSIGKDTNKKTDANHNDNKGTAGNEAHTSTSTHATVSGNGEAHSSATAHASANGGEVKTSATSNVNVNHNTPVVNNNGQGNTETGNASSDRTANNTTSTNGSTETPFNSSSVNDSTGSTYTDNNLVNGPNEDNSTAQTVLPHTGFNMQGAEHTAKEAGAIAGIIAMISGLFFFRRKK